MELKEYFPNEIVQIISIYRHIHEIFQENVNTSKITDIEQKYRNALKNTLKIKIDDEYIIDQKKDKIIVWNDIDIIQQYKMNESIDINIIMGDIKHKIEKKYKIENNIVSVIIPNYNNEYFIKEVIEHILKNTYLNTENSGTYYCRNKGILLSKGSFIFFVDGDDYIGPNLIESMYKWLNNPINSQYWAYQRPFTRIYMNEKYEEIKRVKTPYYITMFRRKIYNYIGFYQDSRFGADTELEHRIIFNNLLYFKEYRSSTDEYFANTVINKNLTSIINGKIRTRYIIKAKSDIKKKRYIRMALIENLENLL